MSAQAAAAAASSAYWRAAGADLGALAGELVLTMHPTTVCAPAGMTYLKYANLCAEVVRGSLKEPFLTKARLRAKSVPARESGRLILDLPTTQAKPRDSVYFKATPFDHGKAGKAGA
jgi:Mitochondrial ATP synthase epsilon chain